MQILVTEGSWILYLKIEEQTIGGDIKLALIQLIVPCVKVKGCRNH